MITVDRLCPSIIRRTDRRPTNAERKACWYAKAVWLHQLQTGFPVKAAPVGSAPPLAEPIARGEVVSFKRRRVK